MNVRNTVKSLLKSVVPENVLRLKRCIGIVRSLHKRFDSAGYVPTQEDMNQMALIRRTYKKIAVLQMPCRNIGGMGLMYQWLCEHRASDTLYLFYREHFDHSKKIPNAFLEKLICRDLVDMEENLPFWLRVLKMCFWKVESLDFGDAYRSGIGISRQFYAGKGAYRYDADSRQTGYFSFTEQEIREGNEILDQLKVAPADYVCLFARDATYYNQFYDERFLDETKWANELTARYRDSDIERFQSVAAYLHGRGLSCVRMGAAVSKRDPLAHMADYTNEKRSDFGDVYVFSNAKFFLGDASGIFVFPLLARKPIAFTNVSSFFSAGDSQTEGTLMIYKKFYHPSNDRYLTLREILEIHVRLLQEHREENLTLCFWKWLSENGYIAISNSEAEINELAEEMLHILDRNVSYTDEEMALKRKYKSIMYEYIVKDEFLAVCAEIGAKWIAKNAWFLESASSEHLSGERVST